MWFHIRAKWDEALTLMDVALAPALCELPNLQIGFIPNNAALPRIPNNSFVILDYNPKRLFRPNPLYNVRSLDR